MADVQSRVPGTQEPAEEQETSVHRPEARESWGGGLVLQRPRGWEGSIDPALAVWDEGPSPSFSQEIKAQKETFLDPSHILDPGTTGLNLASCASTTFSCCPHSKLRHCP